MENSSDSILGPLKQKNAIKKVYYINYHYY